MNCKDKELKANLYSDRSAAHFSLGKKLLLDIFNFPFYSHRKIFFCHVTGVDPENSECGARTYHLILLRILLIRNSINFTENGGRAGFLRTIPLSAHV